MRKIKLILSYILVSAASAAGARAYYQSKYTEASFREYRESQVVVNLEYNGKRYIFPIVLMDGEVKTSISSSDSEDRYSEEYLYEKAYLTADRLY